MICQGKFRLLFKYLLSTLPVLLSMQSMAQEGPQISSSRDTSDIRLLLEKARVQGRLSHTDSALALLREALLASKLLGWEKGKAVSLMRIGLLYQDKGDHKKSKAILFRVYNTTKGLDYGNDFKVVLNNAIGSVYTFMGNNDSAILFLFRALDVYETQKFRDSGLLVTTYSNLGTAWMQKGNVPVALRYQKQAESLVFQLKDSISMISVLASLGVTYLVKKDSLKAMDYFDAALKISLRKQRSVRNLQFLYYMIGNVQQDRLTATRYYKNALELDTTTALCASIYQGLGSTSYFMGRYEEAEKYYLMSQAICEAQNLVIQRRANYYTLSLIYNAMGRYKAAFEYHVAYAALNDSLLDVANTIAVNNLDVKYRTAEKDRKLAEQKLLLAQKEGTIYRNRIVWVLVFTISGGGVFFLIARYRNQQKMALKTLENLQQNQEIERLQYKMNGEEVERNRIARELHDGVSVLLTATQMTYSSLGKENQGIADTDTYREVSGLLQQTSREVKAITHNLIPDLLIQESLPSAIKSFCDLIQKRYQLKIEVQTYGTFNRKGSMFNHTIYRIVQELIHNIVKHARASLVRLQMTHHNGLLQLTIEDNGIGFKQEQSPVGMGMANLSTRIQELKGQLTFVSKVNQGTVVEIEIPSL